MVLPYVVKQKIFAQLLEQSDYGVFILDDQFNYVFVNNVFAKMMGLTPEEIISRPISILEDRSLSVEAKLLIDEVVNNLLLKSFHQGIVDINLLLNGEQESNATIKIMGMHAAGQIYYAGFLDQSNISDEMLTSSDSGNFDAITNLPSQNYFLIQFGDLILDTIKELVLVRINFDRYRVLKTNYSEESVDTVVVEFVQRIYDLNLHDLMLFSRFTDEDFALVFEVDDAQMIRNELDKILQLAERPYFIGNDTIYLHFSAGVCQFPRDGNQVNKLLDASEKALHYVKEKGGDDVFWFVNELNQVSAEKLQLETEIRSGLSSKEFFPVYQPKIDLRTDAIVGFEALVRWRHPTQGIKTPNYFLESVLENKLSFELFCSMAEQVIADLYLLQQEGYDQALCINADTYDFLHPEFTNFMQNMLLKYPIKPGLLHVEVTENSLMQQYDVDVLKQFQTLKNMGVQIALDDFGTGYASISYLRHYPFDYIKIDKSFVDEIEEVNTQLLIVRAIIDLASALNLYTVAEGIETDSQAQVMRDMGCIVGQGYYFGKPMSFEEGKKMIDTQKSKI